MDQYGMWVWINTYENTIFRGMNIHFNPAILMWTEGVLLVLTHCHVITFHHQTLFDLIYQNQVYRLNQESFWRVYKIPSRMKTEWDMDMESTWINHVYIYIWYGKISTPGTQLFSDGNLQGPEGIFGQQVIQCGFQRHWYWAPIFTDMNFIFHWLDLYTSIYYL